jgi:hypothetical protein
MAKTAIALTLALLFASLQCVTLCAAPAQPACPHHQKSIDSCSHELVYLQVAAIVPAPLVNSSIAAVSFTVESIEPRVIAFVHAASPPLRL